MGRSERRRMATALIAAPIVVGLPMLFANDANNPSAMSVDLIVLFFLLPFAAGLALLWHSLR